MYKSHVVIVNDPQLLNAASSNTELSILTNQSVEYFLNIKHSILISNKI